MTTPAPSLAAISRVNFQPWSVRTTISVFDLQQIDQDDGIVWHGMSPFCFGHTKDDAKGGNGSRRRKIC
jgi:hypothetical protein